jgi:hypothetical protein
LTNRSAKKLALSGYNGKYILYPISTRVELGETVYQPTTQKRRTRPPGKEAASDMDPDGRAEEGIKQLVQKYKQEFRIPENTNHYGGEDFRLAEKGYVKFCLKNGRATGTDFSKPPE